MRSSVDTRIDTSGAAEISAALEKELASLDLPGSELGAAAACERFFSGVTIEERCCNATERISYDCGWGTSNS